MHDAIPSRILNGWLRLEEDLFHLQVLSYLPPQIPICQSSTSILSILKMGWNRHLTGSYPQNSDISPWKDCICHPHESFASGEKDMYNHILSDSGPDSNRIPGER